MRTALGIAAVAAVANVAALATEWGELGGIATTIASAVELVPFFPASIIAYAALNAGAIVVATLSSHLAETPRLIAIAGQRRCSRSRRASPSGSRSTTMRMTEWES